MKKTNRIIALFLAGILLLMLDMREMYPGCGNREWIADFDYVGLWDTACTVTLTATLANPVNQGDFWF